MLLLRRPDKPSDFDRRTSEARRRVEEAVAAGEAPRFEPPLWRGYKGVFSEAQHGKCAFCEAFTSAVSTGHVDHFRPKGAVAELGEDPDGWGEEVPGTSNVEGRRPRKLSDRGYWWLAYEWENFCFVCERCNTGWKRTIFPVADEPRRLPPSPDVEESCLLLDPYGGETPSDHLLFDEQGWVEAAPGSRIGFETVRTLGLDREPLRWSREEKARKTTQLLNTLDRDPNSWRETLDDLVRLGDRRYVHAGMVRIMAERWLGLSWEELEASSAAPS